VNFSNAAIGAQKKRIEEVSRFSPFPFLLIWRDGGKQLARRREEKNYEISKKKKKKNYNLNLKKNIHFTLSS